MQLNGRQTRKLTRGVRTILAALECVQMAVRGAMPPVIGSRFFREYMKGGLFDPIRSARYSAA